MPSTTNKAIVSQTSVWQCGKTSEKINPRWNAHGLSRARKCHREPNCTGINFQSWILLGALQLEENLTFPVVDSSRSLAVGGELDIPVVDSSLRLAAGGKLDIPVVDPSPSLAAGEKLDIPIVDFSESCS